MALICRRLLAKHTVLKNARTQWRYMPANGATAARYGTTPAYAAAKTDRELARELDSDAEKFRRLVSADRGVIESVKPLHIDLESMTESDGISRWLSTIKGGTDLYVWGDQSATQYPNVF